MKPLIIAVFLLSSPCLILAQAPDCSPYIQSVTNFDTTASPNEPFSLRMSCPIAEGLPTCLNISWNNPKSFSILLLTNVTNHPIALFTPDRFYIFDIVNTNLVHGSAATTRIKMAAHPKSVKLDITLRASSDIPSIELNMVSLLVAIQDDINVTPLQHSTKISSTTESGDGVSHWTFDNGPPAHLREVRLVKDSRTLFSCSEIKQLEVKARSFPNIGDIPCDKTPWVDLGPDGIDALAALLFRSVAGHAAIAAPKYRTSQFLPTNVDWPNVISSARPVHRALSQGLIDNGHSAR